jgi:hypothetical protein
MCITDVHKHVALIILFRSLFGDVARKPQEDKDSFFWGVSIKLNTSNVHEPPAGVDFNSTLT